MKRKTFILFAFYSIAMLWLLFGQRMGFASYDNYFLQLKNNINLIPFRTIAEYAEKYQSGVLSLVRLAIINLAGNVGVFIPLGVFLPMLWKKMRNYKTMFIISSAIILAVEAIQYFTLLGSFDIDDYILNIIGIFIGFLFFKLNKKLTI